jgi:hypothetical protein
MYDLSNKIATGISVKSAVISSNTTGSGVDLDGYNSAVMIVNVGAEGVTLSGSVYFEVAIEHSDDNSTFTACTQANIVDGTIASSGIFYKIDGSGEGDPDTTGKIYRVGYVGGKRYIRGVITKTGTMATGTPLGVFVIKGNARHSADNAFTAHNA